MPKNRSWPPEDDARLKACWHCPNTSLQSLLPQFPERSFRALVNRASILGLGRRKHQNRATYSEIWAHLREALADAPQDTTAIAGRLQTSRRKAGEIVGRYYPGELYIAGWKKQDTGKWVRLYAPRVTGLETDAPRPASDASAKCDTSRVIVLAAFEKFRSRHIPRGSRPALPTRRDAMVAMLFGDTRAVVGDQSDDMEEAVLAQEGVERMEVLG